MLSSCMNVLVLMISNDVFFAFGTEKAMAIDPITFL